MIRVSVDDNRRTMFVRFPFDEKTKKIGSKRCLRQHGKSSFVRGSFQQRPLALETSSPNSCPDSSRAMKVSKSSSTSIIRADSRADIKTTKFSPTNRNIGRGQAGNTKDKGWPLSRRSGGACPTRSPGAVLFSRSTWARARLESQSSLSTTFVLSVSSFCVRRKSFQYGQSNSSFIRSNRITPFRYGG